jgi:hypothetical protein
MKTLKIFIFSFIFIFIAFNISQAQSSFSVSNKTTGDTLFHINNNGKVGIDTTSPAAELHVAGTDGALFTGSFGTGTIPTEAAGTRMMWYPNKSAFRVGTDIYGHWNDVNIGAYSFATGYNTEASGNRSTAMGTDTESSGHSSTAMGNGSMATANSATALGNNTWAGGVNSTTMGSYVQATGNSSVAMGYSTEASGDYSVAIGQEIEATGRHTIAIALSDQNGLQVTQDSTMAIIGGNVGINEIAPSAELQVQVGGTDGVLFTGVVSSGTIPVEGDGTRLMWYPGKAAFRAGYVNSSQWNDTNIGLYSMAMGYGTLASGQSSTAMGQETVASGYYSTAMGNYTTASGNISTAMGFSATADGNYSTALGYHSASRANYSTALGVSAKAHHNGSIVMAANNNLSTSDSVYTGGIAQMVFRAVGGIYFTNTSGAAPYEPLRPINTYTGGYLSSGGIWTNASSRDYKENVSNLSLEQALYAVQQLQPVTYNYKTDKEEKCIGFIAEDVPNLVAVKDRKGLSPMDIVAVLTKVVQNQQQEMELLKEESKWLKERITYLENK